MKMPGTPDPIPQEEMPPPPELTGESEKPKQNRIAWFGLVAAALCVAITVGLFTVTLFGARASFFQARLAAGGMLILLSPLEIMALTAGVLRWSHTEGKIAVGLILGLWMFGVLSLFWRVI